MINLFLIDIHTANSTNGVDRHIKTLLAGLKIHSDIRVHWIHLVSDDQLLFCKEEVFSDFIKISIPIPLNANEMYSIPYWMKKYNDHIFKYIKHLFHSKENCVIHLHTLNLIDLAVYIKQYVDCRIITHLHCLPWKSLFNYNIALFNQLYNLCYSDDTEPNFTHNALSNNRFEQASYNMADRVICVTHCAEDFLRDQMTTFDGHVHIVPNGIDDLHNGELARRPSKNANECFQCLYVGVVSESKGLKYILKALNQVIERGHKVTLHVAGSYPPGIDLHLKVMYPKLMINFYGCIPFEQLSFLYSTCDIGLIGSLQEQASYVAVEMAMFGLPIVTTAVDGLDELFTDNVNALKVNTLFSPVLGLSVNVEMMADKIEELIANQELRQMLEQNVRQLYESELTLEPMIQKIISVYYAVWKTMAELKIS